MSETIEVVTRPTDLAKRMARYPRQLDAAMAKTMEASLLHVQSSIPGYPVAPPDVNASERTGTLGRTLGVAQSSGVIGKAQIQLVRRAGQGVYEGKLGTLLEYAPNVIGKSQGMPWARYWWNITDVKARAQQGVINLHQGAVNKVLSWLDGKTI